MTRADARMRVPTRVAVHAAKGLIRDNERVSSASEEVAKGVSKAATETLSQLIARILNQLALSAWLPAAALVLSLGLILQLGAHWNSKLSAAEVLTQTLAAIGGASLADVVLLVLIIVVSTMLTQAFSFESIRALEGYWGTSDRLDRLAARRCRAHESRRSKLHQRYGELKLAAWADVEKAMAGHRPRFSTSMIGRLKQRVTGERSLRKINSDQRRLVDNLDWEAKVSVDVLRRLRNVEGHLADYPRDASRVMPTKLGNVLRRYEVETGADDVEGLVERAYPELPFALQLSHDEQRARLDLYCSMVFVLWLCALVAVARFGWWAWPYSLTLAALALAGSHVAYRAAVASARYYGSLLVMIARFDEIEAAD